MLQVEYTGKFTRDLKLAKRRLRFGEFWIFLKVTGRKYGGEGGIRTHVEAYAPHPISSRRRYDRFGTSPGLFKLASAGL